MKDADADAADAAVGTDTDASPTGIMIIQNIPEDDKEIINAFKLRNQFIASETKSVLILKTYKTRDLFRVKMGEVTMDQQLTRD